MATLEQYQKETKRGRFNRYFSEDFKMKKVREIEQNLVAFQQ